MKKSLSEQLADNLAYYVNDPNKRCTDGMFCRYSGKSINKNTQGCFVGKLLSPKDRLKADEGLTNIGTNVSSLCEHAEKLGIKLPKLIKDNERIMRSFQSLHDHNRSWNDTGLTNIGKHTLIDIIKTYNLEKKYFEKFLVVTE